MKNSAAGNLEMADIWQKKHGLQAHPFGLLHEHRGLSTPSTCRISEEKILRVLDITNKWSMQLMFVQFKVMERAEMRKYQVQGDINKHSGQDLQGDGQGPAAGVVDRIFTRAGTNETANILEHAAPNSLVILDELGQGTSTLDATPWPWTSSRPSAARSSARTTKACARTSCATTRWPMYHMAYRENTSNCTTTTASSSWCSLVSS